MKLLLENWRRYLNEDSDVSEQVEEIQEFLSGGYGDDTQMMQQVRDSEGNVVGIEPVTPVLEQAVSRFRIYPKLSKSLKELSARLKNLKDAETKKKLEQLVYSAGGNWLQALELLRSLQQ